MTKYLSSDIKISGANWPTTHTKGKSFYIAGTISSTYNSLYSVSGGIYAGSTSKYAKSVNVGANDYNLKNSTVDSSLMFSQLAVGNYTYKVTATARNYYTTTGTDLHYEPRTVTLVEKDFNVVTSTTTLCKISYNANGGSCSTTSASVVKGGKLSSLPTPTRTGYTFAAWYTASIGGTKVTTSTTFSADTTLYAHWRLIVYIIRYDANGGTGGPYSSTKGHGSPVSLASETPACDGYTFLGWANSRTATTAEYQPGDTFTKETDVTLYAVWQKNAETTALGLLGDADRNGVVEPWDATLILRYLSGKIQASAIDLPACDADGSGVVEPWDATMILRYLSGKIIDFPANAYYQLVLIRNNRIST